MLRIKCKAKFAKCGHNNTFFCFFALILKKTDAKLARFENSPYFCTVLIQAIDCFTLKNFSNTMKKLVFMFAAFAAISFASCGNKTEAPVEGNDSDSVAVDSVDTVAADTVAADSVVAE